MGERRGSNPRMMESQSIALPLGYARHFFISFFYFPLKLKKMNNFFPKVATFFIKFFNGIKG